MGVASKGALHLLLCFSVRMQQVIKTHLLSVDNRGARIVTRTPPSRDKTCSECGAKNKRFTTFLATLKA